MRLYAYHAGTPGFISAEVVISDSEWEWMLEHGVRSSDHLPSSCEGLTREELEQVSTRRRALRAWEAKDEGAFQAQVAAERLEVATVAVREMRSQGCAEAREILAPPVEPERIMEFSNQHACELGVCLPPRLAVVELRT